MKFTTLALASVMLLPLAAPAQAKDSTDGKSEGLAVEKMICEQLYIHKPADDVAYKPGVDVNGKPVAPADLPSTGASIGVPDYIEVPLTVDLAQRLNQPVPEGVKMEGVIGNLRLYKDGKISYNGQDVLPQASAMCGGELKTEEPPAQEVQPMYNNISPQTPLSGSTAQSATQIPVPEDQSKPKMASKYSHFLGQPAD